MQLIHLMGAAAGLASLPTWARLAQQCEHSALGPVQAGHDLIMAHGRDVDIADGQQHVPAVRLEGGIGGAADDNGVL